MLLPGLLVANIGVPMLALLLPAHLAVLLPAALLTAEIGHRRLALPRGSAFKVAVTGKLASALIGVPLVWAAMLGLELLVGGMVGGTQSRVLRVVVFPFTSAWLGPTEDAWRVYLAFAVLIVPCCLLAMATESLLARRMLASLPPPALRSWIRRANLWCYLLLVGSAALYPLLTGGKAWQ